MTKPKVLVGSPCGKTPVFDAFYDCFAGLMAPEGSIRQRAVGGCVAQNLNVLADSAIAEGCTHLFIVEDDSMFAPDALLRLLKHDKPVVAGLCRARNSPFAPYIYSDINDEGLLSYRPLKPEDKGLIRVAATGMGGILINTEVFKKLERPYFAIFYEGERLWGQDIVFGRKLIEAGIEVYCDLDVVIQHCTQCLIGSDFVEGAWQTVMVVDKTKVAF